MKQHAKQGQSNQAGHDQQTEDLIEAVSCWVDGEDGAEGTYERLIDNSEAKRKVQSYHFIGSVLRGEAEALVPNNFSERVSQALESEPTLLTPRHLRRNKSPLVGWSIAASVAVAVVVAVQSIPFGTEQLSGAPLVADTATGAVDPAMVAEYHITDAERAEIGRINNLFAAYAQRNQGSSDVPYVRVVSGEQVRTFRMTPQQFRKVMMELETQNQAADRKAQQERLKSKPE